MFCGLRAPSPTLVSVPTQVPFSCPAPAYGSACCWTRRSSPSFSSSSSSASCPEHHPAQLLPGQQRLRDCLRAPQCSGWSRPAPSCFPLLHCTSFEDKIIDKLMPKSIQRFAELILAVLSYVGSRLTLRQARRSAVPHPAGPQGGAVGRGGAGWAAFPTRSDFRCAPRRGGAGLWDPERFARCTAARWRSGRRR